MTNLFSFDNSYARLPEKFYSRDLPTPVSKPRLFAFNYVLAAELGMEQHSAEELAIIFSGNVIVQGSEPIALAYAGHQFGHFVPRLGDGRAILLGEVVGKNGRRDIQLKGSGQTVFSRRGDGRAALGPVMREYIVSEAMHALGIRTTRSLAAVISGEPVYRETMLPGAILTRVAASHIRIGTFEYFAAQGDMEAVRKLADYTIDRHYPEAKAQENPYLALLEAVIDAQARLVASWMHIGFIHGVMNTDNMAVSGETIDYGPCAFMDSFNPMMVYSAIDRQGRYAFGNQPAIAHWNLTMLAETLLLLLGDKDRVIELLGTFSLRFKEYWLAGMRKKLGLLDARENDILIIEELLKIMHENNMDYTNSFRKLSNCEEIPELSAWLKRWRERLAQQDKSGAEVAQIMKQANPAYIPRNHRIEQAIEAAIERDDFSFMEKLITVLADPYQENEGFAEYALAPLASEIVQNTFCGT